jgi:hypothetical protein
VKKQIVAMPTESLNLCIRPVKPFIASKGKPILTYEYFLPDSSQKVYLTAHSINIASGAMNLRITFGWLCGLAVLAASIARLTAQEGVKSTQSFPPAEPVAENLQPAATNFPAPGAAVSGTQPSQAEPATREKAESGQTPPGTYVSSWLLDIVKLAQAGINRDVMLTFIDSAGTFNLDADQIVYLHELKIPSEVITAMMQHDAEIVSGSRAPGGAVSGSAPGFNIRFAQTESPSVIITKRGSAAAAALPVAARPQAGAVQAESPPPVWREFAPQRQTSDTPVVVSPVRLPYAVQLLDPIIITSGEGRCPNLLVIEVFP